MKRFKGKTILVTGAGSGIGLATVSRLLEEDANVAACDLHVDKVPPELGRTGRLLLTSVDVSDRSQTEQFVADAAQRFGGLFGLVNCAGIRGVGNVLDFEPEAWRRVMSVNLDGTFNMCQFFARTLRGQGTPGAIVNVSSGAGIMGVPNRLAYVASKFGVSGITRTMSAELGPLSIRVNCIAPGMIRTPMTEPMFRDPANVQQIRNAHPIGREGQPEEVAGAIVFMLSDDASFITGAILPVDGGSTACIPSH